MIAQRNIFKSRHHGLASKAVSAAPVPHSQQGDGNSAGRRQGVAFFDPLGNPQNLFWIPYALTIGCRWRRVEGHLGCRRRFVLDGFALSQPRRIGAKLMEHDLAIDIVDRDKEGGDTALRRGRTSAPPSRLFY